MRWRCLIVHDQNNRQFKRLNIVLPVYNEELRLRDGITRTVTFLDSVCPGEYQLTIVDNASLDATQRIASDLCESFPQVKYLRIEQKGVGAAFRAGVEDNSCPIVGYMDIDLSTDIKHLPEMLALFDSHPKIGVVNGSRWAKESETSGRKWYRNITSYGLTGMLKLAVGMKASDSICGFKFFRKDVAESLIKQAGSSENGWFYIIELLLRAERSPMEVCELPVHWEDDSDHSTVEVIPLIKNYCTQIMLLRRKFKSEDNALQEKAG